MSFLDNLHLNVNDPLRAGGHTAVTSRKGGHFQRS